MNEALQQRILRRLESLPDERGYQILDYVEFLESKYAQRAGTFLTRLTETAEDTMRAAGVPIKVISGTMGIAESATKVMKGVAAAATAAVEEAVRVATPTGEGERAREQKVESGERKVDPKPTTP